MGPFSSGGPWWWPSPSSDPGDTCFFLLGFSFKVVSLNYTYRNLIKQIHKSLVRASVNSQPINWFNSLGFHNNTISKRDSMFFFFLWWIFMSKSWDGLLLLYLFLMTRIGFSLLHMMNIVRNTIVEKWWDLLTGSI